jgi:hypothetical protein
MMMETLGIEKQLGNNGRMEFWNDGFISFSIQEPSS